MDRRERVGIINVIALDECGWMYDRGPLSPVYCRVSQNERSFVAVGCVPHLVCVCVCVCVCV
jgi:hypothetical protein